MELKLTIGFKQLLSLANQLSAAEKAELIAILQENISTEEITQPERQLGKYKNQIWMSDDFNEPLEDFKEYME